MKRRESLKVLGSIPFLAFGGINSVDAKQIERSRQAFASTPKNIILVLADGMGVAQWQAGAIGNGGSLNVGRMTHTGLMTTNPLDNFCGDAPSHCTALACGINSHKGAVGVGMDDKPVKNIIEMAKEAGIATGIVSSNTLVEGSNVPFIGHSKNRMMTDEITVQYVDTGVDVFIGAGESFFTNSVKGFGPQMTFEPRADKRDLMGELKQKGYQILHSWEEIKQVKSGKVAGFTDKVQMPNLENGRDPNMYPEEVSLALNLLSQNSKGFFLMTSSMFVDRASHNGKTDLLIKEAINLDMAIGRALDFADKHEDTLVIVAGSPEASGMTLVGGDIQNRKVEARWTMPGMANHSGIMVPYFAYGAGAEQFGGTMLNTQLFEQMKSLLRL